MKKTILILSSIIITGVAFEGCQKKGEGDPAISLHGRKARLSGEWTLSAGTSTDVSGTTSQLTTWTATSKTTTYGTTTIVYTYSDKLTIENDGTWKQVITSTTTGYATTTTYTGTWNWTGGVGEAKKRSQLVMTTLTKTDVETSGGSTSTETETYVGSKAPSQIYDIFQLKNKEIIFKWDGTSTSNSGGSNSTSSSKGEMTYVQ